MSSYFPVNVVQYSRGTDPRIFISALNGHAQFHVLATSPCGKSQVSTGHKAAQAK